MLHGHAFEIEREAHVRGWIAFGKAEYASAAGLYLAYGMLDALWQGVSCRFISYRHYFVILPDGDRSIASNCPKLMDQLCYWLLGISCSTPLAAGKLVAIYKMTQAIGASIAYGLTTAGVSGYVQFVSNWVLIAGALLAACEFRLCRRHQGPGRLIIQYQLSSMRKELRTMTFRHRSRVMNIGCFEEKARWASHH